MGERAGALQGQDTGWFEVVRKKKSQSNGGSGKVDVATSAWTNSYKDTVSFYFSEFPETHGAKEMLRAFKYYGEAMEVVVPPKKEKWGRRFGFVRFRNVGDPRVFAIKLDNIIFGAKKIHVNVPRFQRVRKEGQASTMDRANQNLIQRDHGLDKKIHDQNRIFSYKEVAAMNIGKDQRNPKETAEKHQAQTHQNPNVATEAKSHEKKAAHVENQQRHSYHQRGTHQLQVNQSHYFPRIKQVWREKDTVHGGRVSIQEGNLEVQRNVIRREDRVSELSFTVPEEEILKYRKMFIGTVRTPGSTYSVHEWFNMQGFFSLKVTPLGANKVLLEELEDGVMEELQKNYSDWLNAKFEEIRGWEPDVIDVERVVWVRCHGIPAHAWKEEFFASIASIFGDYLGVDEATRTKYSLDVARMRLRTRELDVFNVMVKTKINNSMFHIKVVEEWCGPLQWIDDCRKCSKVSSDDDSESGDSHGGGPRMGDVWGNNFDEGWEDEGSHADKLRFVIIYNIYPKNIYKKSKANKINCLQSKSSKSFIVIMI